MRPKCLCVLRRKTYGEKSERDEKKKISEHPVDKVGLGGGVMRIESLTTEIRWEVEYGAFSIVRLLLSCTPLASFHNICMACCSCCVYCTNLRGIVRVVF